MADPNKVTQEEFDAAIALIRAARKAVEESEVEAHSFEPEGTTQGFTDVNIC